MIKLQDFARQQGVTDRAIQKHLKNYAEELEGLYERKGPNGTWLTDEACEILRSKMKQAPITIIEPSEQEESLKAQIRDLERELFDVQKRYTDYVSQTTTLLQTASRQISLAEASEQNKKRADDLEAQNARLSADNEKKDKSLAELETKLKNASGELREALAREKDKDTKMEKLLKRNLWQRIWNKE